jgi:hypothetical protein
LLGNAVDVLATAEAAYSGSQLPRQFLLLAAAERVRDGEDARMIARAARTTVRRLTSIADSSDPVAEAFGIDLVTASTEELMAKSHSILGQLVLGMLAERAFEEIYKSRMDTSELRLEDFRDSRNETDYRVLNGHGRPVFRINIKFHGSAFRKATELVGLDPADCFALATYKINQALIKQEKEVLPYIFAIVGVPELTGARVGSVVPENLVHLNSLILGSEMPGKRDLEDQIVLHLLDTAQTQPIQEGLQEFRRQIAEADWRIISARRADKLLREKLFERVYAVRVRAFARNYRNAELDMHFSLTEDLTPLEKFLDLLKTAGVQGLSVHLERGTV